LFIGATKGEEGDMSIGSNLRALRNRQGWGQQELARRAGITQPVISVLESGRQERARSDTLAKLAEALGVEVGDFFAEGTPPPIPDPPKTPLTDEPESDFDARFGATDVVSAEELQEKVGAELDALGGYIKALRAAGIEGDDLRRKQARRRLGEAKRRTRAATSRYADLALNADFGRDRPVYDTLAAYVGEAEAVAAEIEAENAETHPEAV
jgi:transcriptional regulator with XRE-family HTH domain